MKESVTSIISQLNTRMLREYVEIVVSDNASSDKTAKVVGELKKGYKNIRYFKNKRNIGGDANVVKAASYAKGDYIWFFSDDDIHYPDSIEKVLSVITAHQPDVILCNVDLCSKNGKKIAGKNVLAITKNYLFTTKKELFAHLEGKFMFPVDWYTTCLSNTIVSRKLFKVNISTVMKFFSRKKSNFLHSGILYYKPEDYKIFVVAKPLIKFRTDNRSFGPSENKKIDYLLFIHRTFSAHNRTICKINRHNMSLKCRLLFFIKDFAREVRIVLLKYVKLDLVSFVQKFIS